MREIIRLILNLVGLPGDVETIGKAFIYLAGLALVSGLWAAVVQGLHWGVFIALGIFAFGTVAYARLTQFKLATQLEEKITVPNIYLQTAPQKAPEGHAAIVVSLDLLNNADFPIHVRFIEDEYVVGDDRCVHRNDQKTTTLIAPKTPSHFLSSVMTPSHATMTKDGGLSFELVYWRRDDDARCRMRFKTDFNMDDAGLVLPSGLQYRLGVPHSIHLIEYTLLAPGQER